MTAKMPVVDGPFVYVSSVAGKTVARYGTGNRDRRNFSIGAVFVQGTGYVHNTEQVVAIPAAEWNRYRREYARMLREGALRIRSKADYEAWIEAERTASQADADRIAADARATTPPAEASSDDEGA